MGEPDNIPPPPSAVVRLDGQMAEVQVTGAGRDINNAGASPDKVLDFLRSYVFEADQRRETAIKDLYAELELLRLDAGIISDALRVLRDRVDDIIDAEADDVVRRQERQFDLDARLGLLGRRMRRTLWLVVVLAVAIVVVWRHRDRSG